MKLRWDMLSLTQKAAPHWRDVAVRGLLVTALMMALPAVGRAEEGAIDKKARLDFIKTLLSQYELQSETAPLVMSSEPALWYTNPVRSARGTGATFFWLEGIRPTAAISLSIRDGGKVFREFSLLQETSLRATRDRDVLWAPRKLSKSWSLLEDAPTPDKNAVRRLIQMRSLVRRFEARLLKEDVDPAAIRVLPKPLYRYRDPQAGLIDGAVFAFVEATDPEALLLLEAMASETGGSWRYTLARMTSTPSAISLDGQEVWRTMGYWKNPRSREDAYVEAYDSQYEED